MRPQRLLHVALLVGVRSTLAHDRFLKLSGYFVRPGAEIRVTGLNGTLSTTENAIVRSRVPAR
jgi:hypothetical protein